MACLLDAKALKSIQVKVFSDIPGKIIRLGNYTRGNFFCKFLSKWEHFGPRLENASMCPRKELRLSYFIPSSDLCITFEVNTQD